MERELTTKRTQERPRRTSLARRSRLDVRDRDPNYHYRIVNCNLESDPDRVENLMELGYEIVPSRKTGSVGDKKVDIPTPLGSAGQISVGRGTKAIVMRIPKEYFQEDQKDKVRETETSEEAARKSADYGSVTTEIKPHG